MSDLIEVFGHIRILVALGDVVVLENIGILVA